METESKDGSEDEAEMGPEAAVDPVLQMLETDVHKRLHVCELITKQEEDEEEQDSDDGMDEGQEEQFFSEAPKLESGSVSSFDQLNLSRPLLKVTTRRCSLLISPIGSNLPGFHRADCYSGQNDTACTAWPRHLCLCGNWQW